MARSARALIRFSIRPNSDSALAARAPISAFADVGENMDRFESWISGSTRGF
jgi:hypothetical protein